jgi:hypothetical protein
MEAKTSRNLTSVVAALSLASLSMPAPIVEAAPPVKPTSAEITKESSTKLGSLGDTTFTLELDGVRRWLVAENKGDQARVLVSTTGGVNFAVSYLIKEHSIMKVTVGPDTFSYVPFAGGSFVPLNKL